MISILDLDWIGFELDYPANLEKSIVSSARDVAVLLVPTDASQLRVVRNGDLKRQNEFPGELISTRLVLSVYECHFDELLF
jgi:hypothetical protein